MSPKRCAAALVAAGSFAAVSSVPADAGGRAYPTITIPALRVSVPITGNLATGVEFWPGVAGRPGRGPVAIAGHDVTPVPGFGPHGPFHRLGSLRRGDELLVDWGGRGRTYRVTQVVALPAYVHAVVPRARFGLLLSTCWPPGSSQYRLYAYAVEVPQAKKTTKHRNPVKR